MKKQLLIIGIVAILVTVGLSGCQEQTSNQQDNTTNTKPDADGDGYSDDNDDFPYNKSYHKIMYLAYEEIVTVSKESKSNVGYEGYCLPNDFDWQRYYETGYLLNHENTKYIQWHWELKSLGRLNFNVARWFPIDDDINNEPSHENMYFSYAWGDSGRINITTDNYHNYWYFSWSNSEYEEDIEVQITLFTVD